MSEKEIELLRAHHELYKKVTDLSLGFTEEYCGFGILSKKEGVKVILNVLLKFIDELDRQWPGEPNFTTNQIDYICYQIGEWYLEWKDKIIESPSTHCCHKLGIAKEELKIMICGDGEP